MRSIRRILNAPFRGMTWITILMSFRALKSPFKFLFRYATGRGSYPWRIQFRVYDRLDLYVWQPEDLFTLAEIFLWRIYRQKLHIGTFIDIGGNIGLASLFFLKEYQGCSGLLVEPLNSNLRRARVNLTSYGSRMLFMEVAVSNNSLGLEIGVEPTGRYSGIDLSNPAQFQLVESVSFAQLIDYALKELGEIDVVKIDCEGAETLFLPASSSSVLRVPKTYVCEGKYENFAILESNGYVRSIVYNDNNGGGVYYFERVDMASSSSG